MRLLKLLHNSNGIGMLGLLAAVSVIGILSSVVIGHFNQMANQSARANSLDQASTRVAHLKSALGLSIFCDGALRDRSGSTLRWQDLNQEAEIGRVQVGSTVLLAKNQEMARSQVGSSPSSAVTAPLSISRIVLRQATGSENLNYLSNTAWIGPNGQSYTLIKAVVEVRFDQRSFSNLASAVFGGSMRGQTIPLTVARNNSTFTVDYCNQNPQARTFGVTCNRASDLTPPNNDCPSTSRAGGCRNVYYISGIDSFSQPSCACRNICSSPIAVISTTTTTTAPPPTLRQGSGIW